MAGFYRRRKVQPIESNVKDRQGDDYLRRLELPTGAPLMPVGFRNIGTLQAVANGHARAQRSFSAPALGHEVIRRALPIIGRDVQCSRRENELTDHIQELVDGSR